MIKSEDPTRDPIRRLLDSQFIQRLKRRYPISIFLARDCWNVRIQLKDSDEKLVELFDIPMNSDGLVHVEIVIYFLVMAWEVALYDRALRNGARRVRKKHSS